VADRLRAEGVDVRRRGKDRRAREESGELKKGQTVVVFALTVTAEDVIRTRRGRLPARAS
jgi:hypothetical protein